MAEHSEVKSENARNVILSYGENVYFVNKVNVEVNEGAEKLRAIFHARRLPRQRARRPSYRNQPARLRHADGVRENG